MPIASVKITVNGTDHTLTYNAATELYEGTITSPANSSYNQSGHYYGATVTVVDKDGNTTTLNSSDSTYGQYLRLAVKNTTGPTLSIVSPAASAYVNLKRPGISWTVSDSDPGVDLDTIGITIDSGSKITGNSITKTAVTGGYSCSYTPDYDLSEGQHTVKVDASDYDGNAATQASVTFTVDYTAPTFTFTPISGTYFNTGSITISGKATDALSGLYKVYTKIGSSSTLWKEATVDSSGNFTSSYNLASGTYTEYAYVKAVDNAGNESAAFGQYFKIDTQAPSVWSVTLNPNTLNTSTNYTISVAASDSGGIASVKATVNNVQYTLTYNSTSEKYECTATSPSTTSYTQTNHYYPVTITVTDLAGNVTTVSDSSCRLYVKETVSPVSVITYPTSSARITTSTPTITWKVTDSGSGVDTSTIGITIDSGSKITGNSITKTAITGGYSCSYAISSALLDGSHTIKVDATDNDGNIATQVSSTFIVDTVAPSLSVTSPSNNALLTANQVTVTGTASDATSGPPAVAIKINGGSFVPVTLTNGSFTKTFSLVTRSNTITVTATDKVGKVSTVTRNITVDTKPPVLSSVSISPNPVNTGVSYAVSIGVSDSNLVESYVNSRLGKHYTTSSGKKLLIDVH